MIPKPDKIRKYHSAHDRLLKPGIMNFFAQEFPGAFGPVIRENIAEVLIELFDALCPEKTRLKPGQLVWNALDIRTRADSFRRRYKPVILSIVTDDDITMFENNISVCEIRKKVIARIINEAYSQGGVLSTRDISLLLVSDASYLSNLRINYENEAGTTLPHTGVLHDMGSCISHKRQIVYKHVVEKKDPRKVAFETNHSQLAVDRYLKDYNRVKTLYIEGKDLDYIHLVTNIAKAVIKQYIQIIENHAKTTA